MSIITLSRGGLVARVDTKGAQLMGLALNGDEYLWQADPVAALILTNLAIA